MAYTDWSMKGLEFMNCNCDYGCPCQFNAPPTDGTCEAITGMVIEQGHFGEVRLDGLKWLRVWSWPNPIHEGNGTMQMIIDESADAAQRAALNEILHGRETAPGATMLQVFSTTMSTLHEPLFLPIEIDIDVAERRVTATVPGTVEARAEPIRNSVTEPHRVRINLPHGFEYTTAEIASATFKTHGLIAHDYAGVHAQVNELHLTQNWPVR